jgi:hypothetical protein
VGGMRTTGCCVLNPSQQTRSRQQRGIQSSVSRTSQHPSSSRLPQHHPRQQATNQRAQTQQQQQQQPTTAAAAQAVA